MATFLGGNAVLGGLVHGQMRHQFSPVPHVTHALPQQGTDRAAFRRVNVGRRNQVAAQQVRQFLRVYAVILVLAAVDMSGIQGVGQDELDAGGITGVGQPLPVEGAFANHCQVMPVGFHLLKEVVEIVALNVGVKQNLPLRIHEADVSRPCGTAREDRFRNCISSSLCNTS